MEPADLNEFYEKYVANNAGDPNRQLHSSNRERNSMCSFKPTSELIKAMRVSNQIYRRLVAGLTVSDEMIDINGVLPGRASDTNVKSQQEKQQDVEEQEGKEEFTITTAQ